MNTACIRCGNPAQERFRLVMGRGGMQRLCAGCSESLSSLVRVAGDTCQLTLADARLSAWLETGRWSTRDGRSVGLGDIPAGWHQAECPCCATFAEEEA